MVFDVSSLYGFVYVAESKGDKQKNSRVCCPFRRPAALRVLQAETLAQIRDVEETCTRGRELSACPYYTSRSAVPAAQVGELSESE